MLSSSKSIICFLIILMLKKKASLLMLKKKRSIIYMSSLVSLGVGFIKLYLIPLYLFTMNKKFDTVITD